MINIKQIKSSCASCSTKALCLPRGVSFEELKEIDKAVQNCGPYNRGTTLYNQGSPCEALYVVRNGAVKTVHLEDSGEEQIVGFHFAGDLVGFDGIAKDIYQVFAVAMAPTDACRIPLDTLDSLAGKIPSLRRQLFRLMSGQITEEQKAMSHIGHKRVESMAASFLLDIHQRMVDRGLPHQPLKLPMMRQDIANYLGIAPETLSRVFHRFQQIGLVKIEGRMISLTDIPGLNAATRASGDT